MSSLNGKHLEKSETLCQRKSFLLTIKQCTLRKTFSIFIKFHVGTANIRGLYNELIAQIGNHTKEGQSDTPEIMIQESVTYACFLFMIYSPDWQ